MASSSLSNATSSVLPHSHKGFGIPYFEANASRIPVLAARLAGAVETVAKSVSGMFVDESSVPDPQARLTGLLAENARFSPEACRNHSRRQFGWDRVIDHIFSCYEDVLHTNTFPNRSGEVCADRPNRV